MVSKDMFVKTHFVVAFHFCMHFTSLSFFNRLSKYFSSIDCELNISKYALVDADAFESKYTFVLKSIKTFEN